MRLCNMPLVTGCDKAFPAALPRAGETMGLRLLHYEAADVSEAWKAFLVWPADSNSDEWHKDS